MHFARQVSHRIALGRAGLSFLAISPIERPRTVGLANRQSTDGVPDAAAGGITRNRRNLGEL